MIPLSVPEIEGGYPERYGEGAEGAEEEGLVVEYFRRLDLNKYTIRYIFDWNLGGVARGSICW